MKPTIQRIDGRAANELRAIKITYDVYDHADGSVLFQMGNTRVLCAVNMTNGVPPFLKGKGEGWLSAEYAMLPASTSERSQRQTNGCKPNGRSIEISRLIGRSLRSILNLKVIGERTIVVDCDVINADGGTRTASITGASIALRLAQQRWLERGIIKAPVMQDDVAAISVGYKNGVALLDVNYAEDNTLDADFNFVLTRSQGVVEVQGASEQAPIDWNALEEIRVIARQGVQDLFAGCDALIASMQIQPAQKAQPSELSSSSQKTPLFSLQNRFQKTV